jgi:hypothetical protein
MTSEATNMRIYRLLGILVVLAAALAGAAFAAEFRDPKTGLAVDPPPGFSARMGEPTLGDTVEIVVERQTPETSCSISFEESTGNLPYTQEQLNELAKTQERLDLIRAAQSALNDVLSLDLTMSDGVVGVVLVLKSKMEFIAHLRTYQGIFETRRGRTIVQCSAHQDRFDGFRTDYDNITQGVKFPR